MFMGWRVRYLCESKQCWIMHAAVEIGNGWFIFVHVFTVFILFITNVMSWVILIPWMELWVNSGLVLVCMLHLNHSSWILLTYSCL